MHTAATREGHNRMIPLGRYGTIDDVTSAVVHIASDEASYITGHVLDVDGGYMAASERI